jgi:hypothetical protein
MSSHIAKCPLEEGTESPLVENCSEQTVTIAFLFFAIVYPAGTWRKGSQMYLDKLSTVQVSGHRCKNRLQSSLTLLTKPWTLEWTLTWRKKLLIRTHIKVH